MVHEHKHEITIKFIGLEKIFELLFDNNLKLKKIMAKIDELNQLVTDLQTSVDTKQQQIADAIAALDAHIAELQAIIDAGNADGATADQLSAVIANITATKADLEATPTA